MGVCARAPLPSRCQAGVEFECVPSLPTGDDDDCNTVDEDCDGEVDEHYAVVESCGEGICRTRSTPASCVGGVETACAPGAPNGERDGNCDLVDDDCDGVADEDVVVLLGGERRLTDEEASSVRPRLVANGGGFMAAWADGRAGGANIYLRRLDAQGAPAAALQRISVLGGGHFQPSLAAANARIGDNIRVTNNPHSSILPSLVPTPTGFGVAWQDRRAGNQEIWFRHLDEFAVPIAQPVRISDDPDNSFGPSLAWDGNAFAVAWYDTRHGEGEIYVARGPFGCPPE